MAVQRIEDNEMTGDLLESMILLRKQINKQRVGEGEVCNLLPSLLMFADI